MLDPMALAGMAFTLIILMLIGGVIVFTPLTRRLGALLELRLEEKMQGQQPDGAEAAALRKLVAKLEQELRSLQQQQETLEERQKFVEALLQPGEETQPLPAQAEPKA